MDNFIAGVEAHGPEAYRWYIAHRNTNRRVKVFREGHTRSVHYPLPGLKMGLCCHSLCFVRRV